MILRCVVGVNFGPIVALPLDVTLIGSMTAILGISAYFHDSAAALSVDGHIVAAAQQERFSRIKNDAEFPAEAISFCLDHAGIGLADLQAVAYYEKPLRKFDRLLETYVATAPHGFPSFAAAMPPWLTGKANLRKTLRRQLDRLAGDRARYPGVIHFVDHHLSHAAAAFYLSPFDDAAILTCDAVGEWTTTSLGVGNGRRIDLVRRMKFPHSLGLLYSAFTQYCGFEVNSGEYKLMGLAPFGRPEYLDLIKANLVRCFADGSFRLNLDHFDFATGFYMTGKKFHRLFGHPPRDPGSPIETFHRDVAASIQAATEEIMLGSVRHLHALTGKSSLCLSGGVALNCVANGRLQRESPFAEVDVPPAPGDAGGAVGAALILDRTLNRHAPHRANRNRADWKLARLGPSFDRERVTQDLDQLRAEYECFAWPELCRLVARRLAKGQIVGWMQGAMEFGPRALGGRSILADPRGEGTQNRINSAIKFRESFRPFAPIVLADRVHEYFDVPRGYESPFMSFVVKRNDNASPVPAVTHVDGTSRIQTVDESDDRRLFELLKGFESETGCPMLVNTSFNVRDEPIVCSPRDAYACFLQTGLDALVIGDALIDKTNRQGRT